MKIKDQKTGNKAAAGHAFSFFSCTNLGGTLFGMEFPDPIISTNCSCRIRGQYHWDPSCKRDSGTIYITDNIPLHLVAMLSYVNDKR